MNRRKRTPPTEVELARLEAALVLKHRGPLTVEALCSYCSIKPADAADTFAHPWFDTSDRLVRVTRAGLDAIAALRQARRIR